MGQSGKINFFRTSEPTVLPIAKWQQNYIYWTSALNSWHKKILFLTIYLYIKNFCNVYVRGRKYLNQ